MTINSLAPKVLTQNLADREFCLNLGDFWKRPSDRWRLLAKRESRYRSKDGEFSAEKREFITKNSLISVSTQIERISNLISSYVIGGSQGQLSEKQLLTGNFTKVRKRVKRSDPKRPGSDKEQLGAMGGSEKERFGASAGSEKER